MVIAKPAVRTWKTVIMSHCFAIWMCEGYVTSAGSHCCTCGKESVNLKDCERDLQVFELDGTTVLKGAKSLCLSHQTVSPVVPVSFVGSIVGPM